MIRILSFLHEESGIVLTLPVTPPTYTWRHPNRVETVRLDQVGDVNLFGGRAQGSCTLNDCLLPAQNYPFMNPGAVPIPHHYIYQLERWSNEGTVVRFMVSGTPTNAAVLIESVEYGERDGTNDIYCTIVLRQYINPETAVLPASGAKDSFFAPTGTIADAITSTWDDVTKTWNLTTGGGG